MAAGGLGTRVRDWARYLPKECYPVDGRPGLVHLLEEISQLGPARVVVVYHPYYARFVDWLKVVLADHAGQHYDSVAGLTHTEHDPWPHLDLVFVPQSGPYADLTSIINGADHIHSDSFYVAFADNLYPDAQPLRDLAGKPADQITVTARPYDPAEAHRRGVVVTTATGRLIDLVEKPDPAQARDLEHEHGRDRLGLLEGRARLTTTFVQFLRYRRPNEAEPKLALALADYARGGGHVAVIGIHSTVTDLGSHDESPTGS